ncbi:MAG: substrate-binding domain-containing protein [Rubrivivax sp.]|nr:substrate-binding domain-containing protein [Rubrivivax sp.]
MTAITGISSMATRQLLAELGAAYAQRSGVPVVIEAVGGVDAARRVQAGEVFDVVVLASDALERLLASGHLLPGSRVDLVHSPVAIAVRAGAPHPRVDSEDALRQALLAARSISYSTGPSGNHLGKLFERWGLSEQLKDKTVLAPPGVPVGSLVARGEVELGFQQLSELMHLEGIEVVGTLPAAVQYITTFSAAVGAASAQADAVRALLDFMASPQASDAKRRQGMTPAGTATDTVRGDRQA